MVNNIAIVVDSTTIITDELREVFRIEIVQLSISIDNVSKDECMWSTEDVLKAQKENKTIHTACPSPNDFLTTYKKLIDEGYEHILVLPLDIAISHTYESALMAKDLIEEEKTKENIVVLPLKEANYGVALIIKVLADFYKQGEKDFDILVSIAKELSSNFHQCWMMNNLEPLFKGGRLSRLSFIIGSLFKIKPVVGINEETGVLQAEKKFRTTKECDNYFISKIENAFNTYEYVYLRFIRMSCEEQLNALIDKVKEKFPDIQYDIYPGVGPLFTCHLGDNGYGIGYVALKKKEIVEEVKKKNIIQKVLTPIKNIIKKNKTSSDS